MLPRCLPLTLLATALTLSGCDASGLRYQANPQPKGAYIYADYELQKDSLIVSIDTDGRSLESTWIKRPDGAALEPLAVVQQSPSPNRPPPAMTGNMAAPPGAAVGAYTPPPPPPQPTRPLTIASFSSEAAGPPPWQLHIKLRDVPEAVIPNLGAPIKGN